MWDDIFLARLMLYNRSCMRRLNGLSIEGRRSFDCSRRPLWYYECAFLAQQLTESYQSCVYVNMFGCRADVNPKLPGTRKIAEALLHGNDSVTSVNLEHNGLDCKTAEVFASILDVTSHKTLLVSLNLSHNNVGLGAVPLANSLLANRSLLELDLRGAQIPNEGIVSLGLALAENKTLQTINLRWNHIFGEGTIALGNALATNKSLTRVDLMGIDCGPTGTYMSLIHSLSSCVTFMSQHLFIYLYVGARAFARAMMRNKRVTYLNISGDLRKNPHSAMGVEGAQDLADMLQHNRYLRTLEIAECAFGSAGSAAIARSLSISNTSLTKLNIGGCEAQADDEAIAAASSKVGTTINNEVFKGVVHYGMGKEGAIEFAEMLKRNITLRDLDLSSNEIGNGGFTNIAESLKFNRGLTAINLRDQR